ncbi:MAG: hypothetical protein IJ060_11735 [Oscillospiraceae bacterium]|nr:hypothetical protein [Oscillospiraceae bacterium]
MMNLLDKIEEYSGTLCFLALILLCLLVAGYGRKIANEIKFLYRRQEIIDVNDNLRHVPRDINSDFFHKTDEQ